MLKTDTSTQSKTCPKCGANLERCRRKTMDKFIGLFVAVKRYRCENKYACSYTCLRRSKNSNN